MMAMTKADKAMIDAFLAKGAPRQFAEGDTGEDWNLLRYLERSGRKAYPRLGATRALVTYIIDGKSHTRTQFIALVNQLRAAEGKRPIGSPQ
jgi:hypothetical protein